MRQAELKVSSGKQAGTTIPLPQGKFLIGREEDCHLRPNSDLVSRHHCVFTVDEFAVRLRDLGSTNGTFVNGERIRGGVMLNPGDLVSIGKIDFQVVIRDPAHDTATHMSLETDTSVTSVKEQAEEAAAEAAAEEAAPAEEEEAPAPGTATVADLPVTGQPQSPSGDTQFMNQMGMPMHLGYPPQMGYPQMMPYGGYPGYQGYPGMPQPGMGYPMPGMYPQQPQQPYPQQPPQVEEENPSSAELAVRLPNPEETGAKDAPPPSTGEGGQPKTAEAKSKEEAPKMADDIIKQYLKRRPGSK